VLKLEPALAQKAPQDIDGDKCAEVADVAVVIHSRAAGIHTHRVIGSRRELFHLAGERVVESKRQTEIVAKLIVPLSSRACIFAVNRDSCKIVSVPELRKDPVTGRWVIISTDRSRRPGDFSRERVTLKGGFCPFCPGNESTTPPEILAYRPGENTRPDTAGWNLRVVPNKFPALGIEGDLDRQADGMFDKMNGVGAHEVVIETPDHGETLATMPLKRVEDMLWAFRDRILDLKQDRRFKYILVFKNHGEAAGASLEHPHSQIIALPILPKQVVEELEGAKRYFSNKERCIFCDIIRQETEARVRIAAENQDFVTLCPYAPRFPFETWILPKRHESAFENSPSTLYENLARMLRTVLSKAVRVLDNPAYNLVVHSSPIQENTHDYYHWHLEIIPKLTKTAGFEWGTGFYINPTPPEEAAKFLREAKAGEPQPMGAGVIG
jgi:UDPglucose--hexose-1-phosphate uridylyltransferase